MMLQSTTPEFANATSGFANSTGLGGIIFIILIAVIILLLITSIAPELAKNRIIERLGLTAWRSLVYASKGLASLIVFGSVTAPAYYIATADPSTQSQLGKYAGIAVGGYLLLVGVGWLADNAVSRYLQAHPEHESLSELLGIGEQDVEVSEVSD